MGHLWLAARPTTPRARAVEERTVGRRGAVVLWPGGCREHGARRMRCPVRRRDRRPRPGCRAQGGAVAPRHEGPTTVVDEPAGSFACLIFLRGARQPPGPRVVTALPPGSWPPYPVQGPHGNGLRQDMSRPWRPLVKEAVHIGRNEPAGPGLEELVGRVALGDEDAFGGVYDPARRRTGRRALAGRLRGLLVVRLDPRRLQQAVRLALRHRRLPGPAVAVEPGAADGGAVRGGGVQGRGPPCAECGGVRRSRPCRRAPRAGDRSGGPPTPQSTGKSPVP